jgi:NAD-dependent deacetylase sirtuin 5
MASAHDEDRFLPSPLPALPVGVSFKDVETFVAHLQASRRILAVCGAGLSASSGMATFRGAGGIGRTHSAKELSTPEAFARDPVVVWQFHADLRRAALSALPNDGHKALAKLARERGEEFLTIMLNIDVLLIIVLEYHAN